MTQVKISTKDIISVIKNDGRFQGNQKTLQIINIAVSKATGDKNDVIALATEVKGLLNN
jgi:hypothetical protein